MCVQKHWIAMGRDVLNMFWSSAQHPDPEVKQINKALTKEQKKTRYTRQQVKFVSKRDTIRVSREGVI